MKNVAIPLEITDYLQLLEDEEKGKLFQAVMNYAATGESMRLGQKEKAIFSRLKREIDRQREIYERKVNACLEAKALQTEWVAEGKKSAAIRENKKRKLLGR